MQVLSPYQNAQNKILNLTSKNTEEVTLLFKMFALYGGKILRKPSFCFLINVLFLLFSSETELKRQVYRVQHSLHCHSDQL
jgi:hypothetical protein